MSWNYRVIHRTDTTEEWYEIAEVYYDKRLGTITAYSSDPAIPAGDTLDELREDLSHMQAALDKPVIEWADLPGNEADKEEDR